MRGQGLLSFLCDRAGLLACQSPIDAQRVLLRFAGVPATMLDEIDLNAYLDQAETLNELQNGRLNNLLADYSRTHPHIVQRISALIEWQKSEDFNELWKNELLLDLPDTELQH